jgi:ribosomal-protein-alanine N-acetyltransferase
MLKKFKTFLEHFFGKQPPAYLSELVGKQATYRFREATTSDIKELLRLEKVIYSGKTPWTKSAFLFEFYSKHPHLYLVCELNESLVGFAGIRLFGIDGHITNIAVDPHHQNQGIGTWFMEELIANAKACGCETISLEVRVSNIDAQRFYRHLGFEAKRIKANYYQEIGEDGLDMIKQL